MNTASILIKTEPKIKQKAEKIANELGFNLSSIINAFLKQFVKTKTITSVMEELPEIPNARTRALLKKAEKNYKKGKHSPTFSTGEEAVAWLKKQGI